MFNIYQRCLKSHPKSCKIYKVFLNSCPVLSDCVFKSHPKVAKIAQYTKSSQNTLAQYRVIVFLESPKRTNVAQNGRLRSQCLRIGTCHHALSIFGRHMSTPLRRCHVDMLYLCGGVHPMQQQLQTVPTYLPMYVSDRKCVDRCAERDSIK